MIRFVVHRGQRSVLYDAYFKPWSDSRVKPSETIMQIGEIAARSGCSADTIRYYERVRLLPAPDRGANNYRRYEPAHLERLAFIRHCRSLDMSLEDIRRMLSMSRNPAVSCDSVDALIEARLQRVRAQREALDQLERQLGQLRARCQKGHHVADCGILRELVRAAHREACACHEALPA